MRSVRASLLVAFAAKPATGRLRRLLTTAALVALAVAAVSNAAAFYRAYETRGGMLQFRGQQGSVLSFEAWVTPGRRYRVESTTSPSGIGPWKLEFELSPIDAAARTFDWTNDGVPARVFRLREE